ERRTRQPHRAAGRRHPAHPRPDGPPQRPHRGARRGAADAPRPPGRAEDLMSIIGLVLNLILVALLMVAIVVGIRLSKRLKVLRDAQEGFAGAVRDLNVAALRAEQGLAELRAATDEATDALADRIEKGRALSARLEGLLDAAPHRADAVTPDPQAVERRFGALLAAAREAR